MKGRAARGGAFAIPLIFLLVGCTGQEPAGTEMVESGVTSASSILQGATASEESATAAVPDQGSSSAPTTGSPSSAQVPTGSSPAPDTAGTNDSPAPEPTAPEVTLNPSGNIDQTVPAQEVSTQPEVEITEVADFGDEVRATIDSVSAIVAQGQGPGEISGPAISLDITLENESGESISLDSVVVNLTDSQGLPASPLITSSSPMSGTLDDGQSAQGTYIFLVAEDNRTPISVSVSYDADAAVVVFVGNAAQ